MRPSGWSDAPEVSLTNTAWLKTLWPYLMEYKGRVFLAGLCLIGAKLASVSMPFFLKDLVDNLAGGTGGETIGPENVWLWFPIGLLLAYGSVRLLNVLLGEVRDVLFGRVTERAMRRMSLKVFRHLHKLSLDFHLSRQTGALQRDIERGTNGISFLMRFVIFNILPTIFELFLVIGLLLYNYPPWFALITLVAVVSYVIYTARITEWRTMYVREANKMDSSTHARALDSLLNYETVKYFSAEEREAKDYDDSLWRWEQARRKNRLTLFALNSGQALIISIAMTLMLCLSAYYVILGTMTIGDFTLMNAFMFQLFMPLSFLGFVYREVKASLASIEQMLGLLKEKPTVEDNGVEALENSKASIEFSHLNFHYQSQRPILKDLSFSIGAGERVAVVGSSGAGKSTLTKLLFRFYDTTSGDILINGQSIYSLSLANLRKHIGVVPQDTVMFNDTFKNNLLYASPEASDDELARVITMAQLDEFLAQCPDGLETLVGERGLKLSGGEKQRLAIARMLLKRPAIMVFDEATSSLDSRTEKNINEAIRAVSAGHTSLIIAHRLSTIIDADKIVVIEQGHVVEQGKHAELLALEGYYYQLWQAQKDHALIDN
ncbi:MAG: ABC transporter ATP-binding protein/permease [Oleispira sp.]|nr:ABC transporter ATP-binding protein/permease [Oleispira sp.]